MEKKKILDIYVLSASRQIKKDKMKELNIYLVSINQVDSTLKELKESKNTIHSCLALISKCKHKLKDKDPSSTILNIIHDLKPILGDILIRINVLGQGLSNLRVIISSEKELNDDIKNKIHSFMISSVKILAEAEQVHQSIKEVEKSFKELKD